jgi:hypothetical protein
MVAAVERENIPRREVYREAKPSSPAMGRCQETGSPGGWGCHNPNTHEREDRGDSPVHARTYEITFLGQAGTTLRAEFDDCEVSVGPDRTTLRAELPDQGALTGLMQRITGLGLDVIDVSLVAPPPE